MDSPIKLFSIFITLCACALTLVQCSSISCEVPSNLTLNDRFMRANTDTQATLLLPHESPELMSARFVSHENLYTPQSCPVSLPSTGPLDDRSTCPYSNVIDHQPNRYPMTLTKAVCRCKDCFGQRDNHHCEHVVYNIRVLMRTDNCFEGFYQYTEEWYMVSVGCVCSMKRENVSPIVTVANHVIEFK